MTSIPLSKTSPTAPLTCFAPDAPCIPLSISLRFTITTLICHFLRRPSCPTSRSISPWFCGTRPHSQHPLLKNGFTRILKNRSPSRESATKQIRSLKRVYDYTFLVATIPRVASLTLSFTTVLSPTLFREDFVETTGPKRVSLPNNLLLEIVPAGSFA